MQKIYNEGRVVGLSAYELYVRHTLNNFPDTQLLTEREWLASTLGDGASMILKVAKNTAAGVHDYALPATSTLCGANTIVATLFTGQVSVDDSGLWATKVTDYGPLILNNESKSPTTPNTVPTSTSSELSSWDTTNAHVLREYIKLVDGVVFQPGEWIDSGSTPKKDFNPDLNQPGTVRLRITKELEEDVYVLLSGFVHRPIVAGSSKIESGSIDTDRPQDGDFLGLQVYPWACKVIFTVPNEVLNMFDTRPYVRELADGSTVKVVSDKAIVDYLSTDPVTYYNSKYTDSKVPVDVTDLNVIGEGAAVIGTYQRKDKTSNGYTGENYPPVLYGARVTGIGVQHVAPIDIASPGSVKIFTELDLAKNYAKVIPNVYALYRDDKNGLSLIDPSTSEVVKVSTVVGVTKSGNQYHATVAARDANGDDKTIKTISLQDTSNNDLTLTGSSSTSRTDSTYVDTDVNSSGTWLDATNGLTWKTLLDSLGLNRKIEFLGQALRRFRSNLPNIVSGDGGVLDIKGTGASKIAGSLSVDGNTTLGNDLAVTGAISATQDISSTGGTLKSGTNYIVLSNGLRLYISSTNPGTSGVPDGSIGIGW